MSIGQEQVESLQEAISVLSDAGMDNVLILVNFEPVETASGSALAHYSAYLGNTFSLAFQAEQWANTQREIVLGQTDSRSGAAVFNKN